MKLLLILLMTVTVTVSIFGEGLKLGTGFSYSAGEGAQTFFNRPKILIPIVMDNLRIEPEFGIFQNSYDREDKKNGEDSSDASVYLIDFAIGTYYSTVLIDKKLDMFYGGKIGAILGKGTGRFKNDIEDSSFYYAGLSMGIEYKLLPKLTISGDIGLNLTRYVDENEYRKYTNHFILTTSTISVRWYY